jgi:anti-sigma-K factor RskA
MTNGHPTRDEDFDLCALGALDADEKRAIESHLASCAACARKLAEARGRIAMIGLVVPAAEPSPHVREELLARIRASSIATAPATAATPAPRPHDRAAARESASDAARPAPFARWWAAVLAPVGVALAVATIMLWNQNEHLKSQLDNLNTQVAQLRESASTQQRELEESQHAADLLAARDTIVVPLAPMPGAPQGTARVAYSSHMGMLMYDGALAPPPDDKCYQLWLIPAEGAPINAGVFHPTAGETDHWMMQMPAGVTPKAFAITLEPMGGMPHPTGPKLLAAAVS